jgi:regulator of sigma E protease
MLITLLATAIVLGPNIFFHELGHFLAAKFSGVRVERFSMGFGPRLLGLTRGETEYRISAVPFGGYVKMEGEDPDEVKAAGGTVSDRSFLGKSRGARALIVVAGPVMNFIMAVLIYTGLTAYTGVGVITTRQIGGVIEDSPAAAAGLAGGDVVLTVGGAKVSTWDDMLEMLEARLGNTAEMVVDRDGLAETITLDLSSTGNVYDIGLYDFRPAVIGDVKRDGPAYLAGLKAADKVVRIGDKEIASWDDLSDVIRASPGAALEIEYEREGQRFTSTVTPKDVDGTGLIEIYASIDRRPVGLLESLRIGFDTTIWVAKQFFMLPRLILRGTALRDVVGGPVRIGQLAGDSLRWGWITFFGFVAAVSAQLCIVNLLPIPVLDGGHLLILGVEAVSGKAVSLRQRIIAQQIGFAFLIGLMVLVTLVDVSRFFGG